MPPPRPCPTRVQAPAAPAGPVSERRPGEGSSMTATLELEAAPRVANAPATPPVKVLCVDDLPANLLALEATLTELNLDLVHAHSGPEALRRILKEDFALILMDVKMPDMDGLETAELIRQRKRCQHTPIIFLTASERNDPQMFKGY